MTLRIHTSRADRWIAPRRPLSEWERRQKHGRIKPMEPAFYKNSRMGRPAMTSEEHFYRPGEAMCDEPILYRACGLDGIYLCNGYTIEEYDGETYTQVEDREQLHRVIALNLVEHRKTLSPKELRFIRNVMGKTQGELGKALGVSSQTVAQWEKGQSEIPGPADRMLRVLKHGRIKPMEQPAPRWAFWKK